MRTKLQGGVVVGFDGHSHVLIRAGVVVWEDDRITFVGKAYDGPIDRTLHAPDRLIIPGLIDLHWHAGVRATGGAPVIRRLPSRQRLLAQSDNEPQWPLPPPWLG